MPKDNYPRPSLSQQEEDFLKRFSLRKFTVPKEKLQDHSPFLYQQKNEDLDLDLFPRKRVRIEYKELKRSLKTNVPWWLRTKGLEEDMNTERLATLVEDSDDDYYSARLDAGVDRQEVMTSSPKVGYISEAPSPILLPKLSSSSRRGIEIIEEFLKIAESSNGKIPDHTLNEIIDVEKRLTRVHRILNNFETVRLNSGCEKCQGKPTNNSLPCDNNDLSEDNNYPEISFNAPETRFCVCDLECVDTEIENLCCCLQKLLEENGLCDDPCQYATIIERLQEIRQSLNDFTKRVMFCSEDALCPDPLSEKFEKKEYLNDCERGRSSTDVPENCIPIPEECEEKPSKSKEKSKGKSCSCLGKKNNSDSYDVAPPKKQSKQKEVVTKTDPDDECEIEYSSVDVQGSYTPSTEKVKSKGKEKKSKNRKKCGCFGKNVSFEGKEKSSEQKTIQSSSKTSGKEVDYFKKEQFYICCKETQTDWENSNVEGRPMFIPCLVLKQAFDNQSSSFDLPTEENRSSQGYLEPNCGRNSSNSVKISDSQKQCMCEENLNSEDACTDMYFCTPLNQHCIEDDERCKDRPQAGISKVDNRVKNICPHCCKCIRPQLGQSERDSVRNRNVKPKGDRESEIKEARTSYALKVGDPKSRSSGEISLRNNSTGRKGVCSSKDKEERSTIKVPKWRNSTQNSGSNKAEKKGVSFSKTKECSESIQKSKPCSTPQDAVRKSNVEIKKIRDDTKGSESRDAIQRSLINSKAGTKCSPTSETNKQATSQHSLKNRTSNIEDFEKRDFIRRSLRRSNVDTSAHISEVKEGSVSQHVSNSGASIKHCSKKKDSTENENAEGNRSNISDVMEENAVESALKENNKVSEQEEGKVCHAAQKGEENNNVNNISMDKTTSKREGSILLDVVGKEVQSDQNISKNQIQQCEAISNEPDCSDKRSMPENIASNNITETPESKNVQSKNDDELKDIELTVPPEEGKLRNQEPSEGRKLRRSKILPQPKLEDVQIKVQEPSDDGKLTEVKVVTVTELEKIDKAIIEELGQISEEAKVLQEIEKPSDLSEITSRRQIQQQSKAEQNVVSPDSQLGLKKDCKTRISGKSKTIVGNSETVPNLEPKNASHALNALSRSNGRRNGRYSNGPIEQKKLEEIEISSEMTDITDDKKSLRPFKADPNISQPEQEIRVCLYNKRRSSKSSKRNDITGGTEIGTLSTKLPTKFCNDCFGKKVPIIKNNLADEIRKMIGDRKRNSVFLKFTVVKDDLYHMQMSTESAYLGCLYATESATFAARDANGFDGCTTLSVTDTSNTRLQIESLVDHAFMVVQHEKRSSN